MSNPSATNLSIWTVAQLEVRRGREHRQARALADRGPRYALLAEQAKGRWATTQREIDHRGMG